MEQLKKAQNWAASALIVAVSIGCAGPQKYKDWKQIEYRNCGGFEQRASGNIVDGEPAVIRGKINICSTGKAAGKAKLVFISMNGDTVKRIEADEAGKFIDTISPEGFQGNVIVTGFASGLTMNNVYIEPSFKEYYFDIKLSQYPSYINEFEGSSQKETKKLRKEIEKLKR
jgi:hypothetical protein